MKLPRVIRHLNPLFLFTVPFFTIITAYAQPAAESREAKSTTTLPVGAVQPADAWKALETGEPKPLLLREWIEKKPSAEDIDAWTRSEIERLTKLAGQADDYYSRFPADYHAQDARIKQRKALVWAVKLGDPAAGVQLQELEQKMLNDPGTPAKERYEILTKHIRLKAGADAVRLEKAARDLMREFPEEPKNYEILLLSVGLERNERNLTLLSEILKSNASEYVKRDAKGLKLQLEAIGEPLDIHFTALDGRHVDLRQMRGNVVLIDFWATWSKPSLDEISNLKDAYSRFHDRGFEILGISFDSEQAKLEKVIKDNELPWPQYFDANDAGQRYAQKYAIRIIPTMWLVDKKGALRDINARANLADRIEKLLAEL